MCFHPIHGYAVTPPPLARSACDLLSPLKPSCPIATCVSSSPCFVGRRMAARRRDRRACYAVLSGAAKIYRPPTVVAPHCIFVGRVGYRGSLLLCMHATFHPRVLICVGGCACLSRALVMHFLRPICARRRDNFSVTTTAWLFLGRYGVRLTVHSLCFPWCPPLLRFDRTCASCRLTKFYVVGDFLCVWSE